MFEMHQSIHWCNQNQYIIVIVSLDESQNHTRMDKCDVFKEVLDIID